MTLREQVAHFDFSFHPKRPLDDIKHNFDIVVVVVVVVGTERITRIVPLNHYFIA